MMKPVAVLIGILLIGGCTESNTPGPSDSPEGVSADAGQTETVVMKVPGMD